LAQRLVGWYILDDRFQPDWGEIVVGQVPADWPVTLPIPNGATVLGSVAYRPDGQLTSGYVLLQAHAVDVIAFYDQALPDRSSVLPPEVGRRGIWASSDRAGPGTTTAARRALT
jgi:hypothetical protein